jgi:hypothetical protein
MMEWRFISELVGNLRSQGVQKVTPRLQVGLQLFDMT